MNLETIERQIGEAIGRASVCWSETPKGEFDSTTARTLVSQIMDSIKELDKKIRNPKLIETITPKSTYSVPQYKVENEGLVDAGEFPIYFCKGNKEDSSIPRQTGFFTESLIAVAKKYLEENNVGDLASRETSTAITKLDEALMWLNKRAEDRALRGVQGTYRK